MAMTLRLTPEQTRALQETADREHTSMHAIAVQAIEAYTSGRAEKRDALLRRIVAEDAAVLARLADA